MSKSLGHVCVVGSTLRNLVVGPFRLTVLAANVVKTKMMTCYPGLICTRLSPQGHERRVMGQGQRLCNHTNCPESWWWALSPTIAGSSMECSQRLTGQSWLLVHRNCHKCTPLVSQLVFP